MYVHDEKTNATILQLYLKTYRCTVYIHVVILSYTHVHIYIQYLWISMSTYIRMYIHSNIETLSIIQSNIHILILIICKMHL